MRTPAPPIDILIVTPLDEERDAVLARLPGQRQLPPMRGEAAVYYHAALPATYSDGEATTYEIVVTFLGEMGQAEAAASVAAGVARWKPRYVLIVGIAGGVRANKVALGDILIASKIIGYELAKARPDGQARRWQPADIDSGLLQRARAFTGQRWHGPVARLRPERGQPKVHAGPVATGDKIIEDPALLDELLDSWPKLIGVEMEAGGGAAGVRQASPPPQLFMIRAVSDLADPAKESTEVKAWRPYACAVVAAYAIAFLRSGPIPPREDRAPLPPTTALTDPSPVSHSMYNPALTLLSEQQAAVIGGQTARELGSIRDMAREGRREEAQRRIAEIKANRAQWLSLDSSPSIQAQVLRLETRLYLDAGGDPAEARRMADRVRALDAAQGTLLEALLAYHDGNPGEALTLLAGHTDADGLHFRAVLQLVSDDVDACLATLDQIAAASEVTAETHRLRALACLARRDLAGAELALGEAARLAPRWTVVRLARATLDYWRALSPLALPLGLTAWPTPPDWILVRRDDAARDTLRAASNAFAGLATETSAPDARREMLRWRLACVGNDRDQQAEAAELCRALLAEDPTDSCALAWGMAREWAIDTAPGETALRAAVEAGTAIAAQVTDLVGILIGRGRPAEAVRLLDRPQIRDRLIAEGASDQLERLRAHAAAHAGDSHRAKVGTSTRFASRQDLHARTVALLTAARRRPNPQAWDKLLRHLVRSYGDSGDPAFRLLRCQVLADMGTWSEVAEEAEWLANEVATYDALRLAAIATLRARRYDQCLALLSAQSGLCPGGTLTDELRQIRISALRRAGRLVEAIAEAEARARIGGGTRELLDLAQLYLDRGDRREFGRVARQLVGRVDLDPEVALRVAQIASLDDREVARRLATQAFTAPLQDALLGDALYAGVRLGLDREMGQLFGRAVASGGAPGLHLLEADEFAAEWQRAAQHAADAEGSYHRGEVPVHLLPGNLAMRYRARLARYELAPDPLNQGPLYILDGARRYRGDAAVVGDGRRLLDLTALLLAAHLDLLAPLAARYGTLYIAPFLPTALHALRAEIAPQPEEVAVRRDVIRLLDRKLLTRALPQAADRQDDEEPGRVQASPAQAKAIPLITTDSARRGNEPAGATISPVGLAHALHQAGQLASDQLRAALSTLTVSPPRESSGTAIPRMETRDLPARREIHCDAPAAQLLARAGILEIACRRWQLAIPSGDVDALRATVEANEERQQLADWLAPLQDRVSDGLGSGTFALARLQPSDPVEDDAQEAPADHPVMRCFEELLRAEYHPGDIVWVDDRFVSRYERVGEFRLCGILDILADLEAHGTIDALARWEAVRRLRAGNVRSLPLTEDEVLHHVMLAPLDDGRVVETPELATLRRSYAACLVQHSPLRQPNPNVSGDLGELEVVFRSRRAVTEAIIEVWATTADEREAAARATWLLNSLYLDPLGAYAAVDVLRPDHDRRMFLALGLAELLSGAINFRVREGTSPQERRRSFFAWLDRRLLAPHYAADPALPTIVAGYVASIVTALIDSEGDKLRRSAIAAFWQRWHEDLPDRLDNALAAHPAYLARIGLMRRRVKTIGGLKFDGISSDRALAAAMRGRKATIWTIDQIPVTFSPALPDDPLPRSRLTREDTRAYLDVTHPELDIFRATPAERAAGLRRVPAWFDIDEASREAAITEISSLRLPHERLLALDRWRDASAAWHFASLASRVAGGENLTLADLLPRDINSLLRHFRLPADDPEDQSFAVVLDWSASALLASEGLPEAILRLAGLPVPLPETLRTAIAALGDVERQEVLRQLLRESVSPPALAQVVHLFIEFSRDEAGARLPRRILRRAVGPVGVAACGAFVALLTWVVGELGERQETREWSTRQRLAVAWGCADRLYRLMRAAGIPAEAIEEAFRDEPRPAVEVLRWNPDLALDIAHPHQARPTMLLASACRFALDASITPVPSVEPLAGSGVVLAAEDTQSIEIPDPIEDDDRSSVVPGDWDARWRKIALLPEGEQVFPTAELVRHLGTAGDSLGSWLAAPWGDWLADRLAPHGDLIRPEVQCQQLAELSGATTPPESDWAWGAIVVLLGSLPPPACAEALPALLRQADYLTMARRDPDLGLAALRVASSLARSTGDAALRTYVREQLQSVAEDFAKCETDADVADVQLRQDRTDSLLEVTIPLGHAGREDAEGELGAFADLVVGLAERFPACRWLCRRALNVFARQLPAEDAAPLWRALVRIRAL